MTVHDPAGDADPLAKQADARPVGDDHRAGEHAETVKAFSAFYRAKIKLLTGYLITLGAPPALAAEFAQDCMLELLKRWTTVPYPRAYVYKIAGQMWARRFARVSLEEPVEELPEPTSLVPRPDALAEFETRHDVVRALRELPPRQRQVLALTLQEFTPTEIAEQLDLDPATVRAHLWRARRAVSARVEGSGGKP
ncbi:sigma-70 family RNA polymerase sigma factor [Kitasatospora sp. NBC_00240]|uniref:RNA polymerase sigma factor n=1 Tax=Kitasatospora sp. NBC_00240 TaxID=2903567 RepID=UPI00224FB8E8|nr:sigma-70 family RNA polymerase sigma factor [Kitasatospora sp. NBC_00240]MCX5215576.1 sigma-70 family RNA polymerase sigma factor [Kitasatospora sp. NBC_00240]